MSHKISEQKQEILSEQSKAVIELCDRVSPKTASEPLANDIIKFPDTILKNMVNANCMNPDDLVETLNERKIPNSCIHALFERCLIEVSYEAPHKNTAEDIIVAMDKKGSPMIKDIVQTTISSPLLCDIVNNKWPKIAEGILEKKEISPELSKHIKSGLELIKTQTTLTPYCFL